MAAGSSYEVGSIVSTPRHSAPARLVADPERPPCAVCGRQTLVALTGVIRISFFNNDGSSRSHEDSRSATKHCLTEDFVSFVNFVPS